MSTNYDALTVIRQYSMPIHKKLDDIGISTHLRNGTLDSTSYLLWLQVTYRFLSGFELLMKSSDALDEEILAYSPSDLCIDLLKSDIQFLSPNSEDPPPHNFPTLKDKQLTIVPVYTLLGSLMGTQMIYNQVKKIKPSVPTTYLVGILRNKGNWPAFKSGISAIEMKVSQENLAEYTSMFWAEVYDGYKKVFM